ncbi:MAG: tRNA uridine-5-carboxymethylaminomethyl(34) synthesis GTPase MnmE [Desulfotalea sp.]|nr:MAG: tRNA uridine-5-carboxymethylaminomethyl(34) synthesis GTPase MnmE [Desulfotalea sp.]
MTLSNVEDTIAAISTPAGAGGIGIIRISGVQSLAILQFLFTPKDSSCKYRSHQLYYGHIHHPEDGRILDEVMAVIMKAPHSYTREDVVEIHCHGSFLVLQNILDIVVANGAVLAAPGEFTKRAFLNGRIDLTRAEAVIDILSAKTRKGVDLAQEQLSGALYRLIEPLQKTLTEMRAVVEVAIDFPDEDIDIVDSKKMISQVEDDIIAPLTALLTNVHQGRLYREGVALVIAGRPNVGKSSLLNTLLQEERALVTSIPGTTRDSIEEIIDIEGIPVRIIDTAGIRSGAGEVEELGILRAKDLINKADLVLFLVDGSLPVAQEEKDLYAQVSHKPVLTVINKIDLGQRPKSENSTFGVAGDFVEISAKKQLGIDSLKQAIFKKITSGTEQWEEDACSPNLRHQVALKLAKTAAMRVLSTLQMGLTNDLIAVDLQECLNCLGEIVGETTTDDVLDVVFEQFCLGK